MRTFESATVKCRVLATFGNDNKHRNWCEWTHASGYCRGKVKNLYKPKQTHNLTQTWAMMKADDWILWHSYNKNIQCVYVWLSTVSVKTASPVSWTIHRALWVLCVSHSVVRCLHPCPQQLPQDKYNVYALLFGSQVLAILVLFLGEQSFDVSLFYITFVCLYTSRNTNTFSELHQMCIFQNCLTYFKICNLFSNKPPLPCQWTNICCLSPRSKWNPVKTHIGEVLVLGHQVINDTSLSWCDDVKCHIWPTKQSVHATNS